MQVTIKLTKKRERGRPSKRDKEIFDKIHYLNIEEPTPENFEKEIKLLGFDDLLNVKTITLKKNHDR